MELEELKGLKKEIYPLLEEDPKLRDDDMVLYLAYLFKSFLKVGHRESFFDFIFKIFQNPEERKRLKVMSFTAVERARRKLQELYPELRGKNYKSRQEEQEVYKEYAKEK